MTDVLQPELVLTVTPNQLKYLPSDKSVLVKLINGLQMELTYTVGGTYLVTNDGCTANQEL
jgi:hypothetical protein